MRLFWKLAPAVALTSLLTMTAAPVAFAKDISGFSLKMTVPDDWTTEGDLSQSPDNGYGFVLAASSHGNNRWTAGDADAFALARAMDPYRGKMKNAVIDTHAHAVQYGPFVGFEVYGHAMTANKEPAKWFVTVLQRSDRLNVACWTIGFGTKAAFQKYQPAGLDAVKSVRIAN